MADIKKIGVLTGGGDCSGLNAVVRAVVLTAINKYGCEVVGFKKGYAGLYANDFMALTVENTKTIADYQSRFEHLWRINTKKKSDAWFKKKLNQK